MIDVVQSSCWSIQRCTSIQQLSSTSQQMLSGDSLTSQECLFSAATEKLVDNEWKTDSEKYTQIMHVLGWPSPSPQLNLTEVWQNFWKCLWKLPSLRNTQIIRDSSKLKLPRSVGKNFKSSIRIWQACQQLVCGSNCC